MDAFTDAVIENVRAHSCIFDKGYRDFKNSIGKGEGVGRGVCCKRKIGTEEDCKRKWRSLSKRFTKEKNKHDLPIGSEATVAEIEWLYLNSMYFLRKCIQPRQYVAICHPFVSHTLSKLSRAVKFVLAMWVLAMCLAIPQTLDLGITHYKICTIKRSINRHIFAVSTILVFVFPMTVITILYILIALRLKKSKLVKRDITSGSSVILKHNMFKKSGQKTVITIHESLKPNNQVKNDNNNHITSYQHAPTVLPLNIPENGRINFSTRAQSHGSRHVVNMLVAVVVAFFICWAPFHAQRLFAIYLEEDKDDNVVAIYQFLTYFSGVLYFISTCINPFLYNIMSNKFRQAFKDTLARYLYRGTNRQSIRQGGLSRNISQRSCSYSQSANTCSSICSSQFHNQTNSIRHLDNDYLAMSFQSSKRPLVISFRRIPQHRHNRNEYLSHNSYEVHNNNLQLTSSKIKLTDHKHLPRLWTKNLKIDETDHETTSNTSNLTKLNFIRKSISETNLNTNYSSVLFYPINEIHNRYNVGRVNSIDSKHKFNVLNFKEIYKMKYKSPYESPEMSLNSKKLEENLNKILKDLVMYQKRTFSMENIKMKPQRKIVTNTCTKISFNNNFNELKDKCQSMPSMYCTINDNIYVNKCDNGSPRNTNIEVEDFLVTPPNHTDNENVSLEHPLHILIKESEFFFD